MAPDNDRLPRKLSAILYADVAGYSRLMGDDEDRTHRLLRDYLDVITAIVSSHGGHVVHYAGDAVLAEFSTATWQDYYAYEPYNDGLCDGLRKAWQIDR